MKSKHNTKDALMMMAIAGLISYNYDTRGASAPHGSSANEPLLSNEQDVDTGSLDATTQAKILPFRRTQAQARF